MILDRETLERYIDEHAGHAYRFAFQLSGNDADARDLVQDAFARALDRAEQFDGDDVGVWFLTLLKRIYVDSVRRWERKTQVPLDTPIGEEGLMVSDVVADPREEAILERLERAEGVEQLRRAMESLTPDARAVVHMIDVQGMRYHEAAAVLGCPLNTVRSRLFRAREILRERLLASEVSA
jgi:RNA polymerase sigma-70 factor (ECF subfamily)